MARPSRRIEPREKSHRVQLGLVHDDAGSAVFHGNKQAWEYWSTAVPVMHRDRYMDHPASIIQRFLAIKKNSFNSGCMYVWSYLTAEHGSTGYMVAQSCSWSAEQGNMFAFFPFPRSRLRIWSVMLVARVV